ncbi:MAG: lytic transglycosylase domain-containing protein [Pseudomonadota bacterium]
MRIRFASAVISVLSLVFVGGCSILNFERPSLEAAPKPAKTAKSETTGKPYDKLISHYAVQNGVPVDLAHAVVFSESTYRANATGAVGEVGLMQLRMATARMVGYTGSRKGLYDPETNIKYGMKYLGQAHKLGGGTTCGTILKYNAGHGAKRMNPISQNYCDKVRKLL